MHWATSSPIWEVISNWLGWTPNYLCLNFPECLGLQYITRPNTFVFKGDIPLIKTVYILLCTRCGDLGVLGLWSPQSKAGSVWIWGQVELQCQVILNLITWLCLKEQKSANSSSLRQYWVPIMCQRLIPKRFYEGLGMQKNSKHLCSRLWRYLFVH